MSRGARRLQSGLLPAALILAGLLPAALWPQDAQPKEGQAAAQPAALQAEEAQPPVELFRRTDALAADGDVEGALALYRQWLRANGEAQDFGRVLSRAADAAVEASDAMKLLAEFAPRVRDPAEREGLLERQASLLRLSGRIEDALVVQIGLPDTPARLVERAGLCLELGLAGEAEQILQRARESGDPEAAAAARVLLADVYLATERDAQAETELRGLLQDLPQTQAAPAALLALGEALRARGDARGAEEALAQLKARFPTSPEALLAAGGGRRAALPMRLLPPAPQEQPAATEAAGPARMTAGLPPASTGGQVSTLTAPPTGAEGQVSTLTPPPTESNEQAAARKVLVQAGSFRDPENARYFVRDLEARGFAARVVEKPQGEARYYRVLVGPEQSPQDAQALILRLKDAGYEGFLLVE